MSKFLDSLQAKSKAFGELSHTSDAIAAARQLLTGLTKGLLLKSSRKELKSFYSDKNFIAIKQMVIADRKFLATAPTSDPTASVKDLNLFQLYLELKTQEDLKKTYPDKILTNPLQSEKYSELLSNVKSLLVQAKTYATTYNVLPVFNSELNKKKVDVENFRKLFRLIK